MRAVLASLVLPNFVFALLDRVLGADAWARLGPLTTKPLMEHERERVSSFVRFPMNAHSSHAHCAAGAYILVRGLDARAPHASALLGASTVAMGLASFVWWSSKRLAAQKLDRLMKLGLTELLRRQFKAPPAERHAVHRAIRARTETLVPRDGFRRELPLLQSVDVLLQFDRHRARVVLEAAAHEVISRLAARRSSAS